MADLINIPTLDLSILKPRTISVDVKAGGLEGGRNGIGEPITIDLTGGGYLMVEYGECGIHDPQQHAYISYLGALLNSGFRTINVPIMTDWMGPFPKTGLYPQPLYNPLFDPDESLIDGATSTVQTVFGYVYAASAANAGIVYMDIVGMVRPIEHSEWFSIFHSTKGFRAYRTYRHQLIGDVVVTVSGKEYDGKRYTLWLDRPLRQAIAAGEIAEFGRPRNVMRFPADFTLSWSAGDFWVDRPSIRFTEAF